jgi:hypothetical protein
MWDLIPDVMNTLKPGMYLDGSIVDYVLMRHWFKIHHKAKAWLVLGHLIHLIRMSNSPLPDDNNLNTCRRHLLLPMRGGIPMRPVVLPILKFDHYWVVVFDYQTNTVHVLGERISVLGNSLEPTNWESWDGPLLWNCISHIFGWDARPAEEVSISRINWLQVRDHSIRSIDPQLCTEWSGLWTNNLHPHHDVDN